MQSATLSSQAYVLSIASISPFYAASASSPSNVIDLFDQSTLQGVQTLPGHEVATTSLRTIQSIASSSRPALASCGKDGTVKAWDERSNSVSINLTTPGRPRPLLCFDVSPDGFLVAAGTDFQGDDAPILYWDPRNPVAPFRTHASTHSDDVTSLHFLPAPSLPAHPNNVLLSASTDGLISTSNADEDDEDEAILYVANWGCSVSQAGWIHGQGDTSPRIWAASDMETFSTWSNELDMIQSMDVRGPSTHDYGQAWVTDYLIGCHNMSRPPGLTIFVGSNEGNIALMSASDHSPPWSLHRSYVGGHTGIVRSILWDEVNNVLITGGEDSKLNTWANPPLDPSSVSSTTSSSAAMDVDADTDPENTPSSRKRSASARDRETVEQSEKRRRT